MLNGFVPWPDKFVERYRSLGYWKGITVFDSLVQSARLYPEKIAVVDGERECTYSQLLNRAEAVARGLYSIGLRAQDRVVFQLSNGLELIEVFFALMRIGAIPVLALPAHRRNEIVHFAKASGAKALFIPDINRNFDFRDMAREVQEECQDLKTVIVVGRAFDDQRSFSEVVTTGESLVLDELNSGPNSMDVALMLLSGGTTGLSKLIPRTHDDYLYGVRKSAEAAGMDANTVFLAILPMAHNYTLGAPGLLGTLEAGGTVVVAGGFSDDIVFPLIERHRVTVLSAAVPLVYKWLNSPLVKNYDFGSLQVFMNGGAKLAPELRRRVEETFFCTYQESFGTAEGLLNMTRLDDPLSIRMESSGRPVSEGDEIKVVDHFGNELPDGECGELVCRGPYTIRGYFNSPEINNNAFTSDGFYRMGDVVKKKDGYLYLEGRIKELINRGGEKISCEEIENYILGHPAVESVCVVAMPDPEFGEKACAFVILRAGRQLTLKGLVDFLETREISKFKFPERLEVVDSFPISAAGKILRRVLRERLSAMINEKNY